MAPEVMCRQNHGVAVDYFALGVIVFECIFGFRPYRGKCRKEIRDQILAKQIKIKRHDIPPGWSVEACDFANRLLQRKPTSRLGLNGPIEVKSHPWFDDFPWDKLEKKEIIAPFIPDQVDNFDVKVTNDGWKDEDTDKMKESAMLIRRDTVQDLFKGYYYDQSFEEFNFSIREAVKPLSAVVRRPAHRSCQLSPKRIVSDENENTFIKKQPFSHITSSKIQETCDRNNGIVYHQSFKPISQQDNSILNQIPSRNILIKNAALPKGPFHYRNESKKISQICSRSSTRRSTKSGSASQH